MNNPVLISFHGFWGRFFENEQNNISFFIELFSEIPNVYFIKDADESTILVNSLHSKQEKREGKINILFAPEPHWSAEGWSLVLAGIDETKYHNGINIPLFVSYLYCGNFLPRCINRSPRTNVPSKFCCWIVSNDRCIERNNIFHTLNLYKKVDSVGRAFNTSGYLLADDWGSDNFFKFISQYKFVICGENTKIDQYITEKIFHGYLSQTLPIYWGTDYAKNVFHPDSYLNLENATSEGYHNLIQKVIEIDNDDSKWLKMVNSPVFINNTLLEELTMNSLKTRVAKRVKDLVKL